MSSSFASLLASQFDASIPNPQLNLIKHLKAEFPHSKHLTVTPHFPGQFPLSAYLASISISPSIVENETHSIVQYDEYSRTVYVQAIAGISSFTYESADFRLFKATWTIDCRGYEFYHLVFSSESDATGKQLATEVYKWANELKEEMWVYEGGHWQKDKNLYKAMKAASWDDIVLDEKFKEGIRRDTQTFFANKDTYNSMGITWKRGILLLGPPGNGKTESIKALLNETKDVNPLYVKSFTTRVGPEHGVREIFNHARTHTPCILILEDLDSMVVPEARSFFLNELDGLADNAGILTIATTNHPERIDDAILNRPSRFDVKYDFTLPDLPLREAFAKKWLAKVNGLAPNTGVSFASPETTALDVAEKTETWSFAFLKELFVSFLLRMAHDKSLRQDGSEVSSEPVEVLLVKQIEQLAAQIIKIKEETAPEQGVRDNAGFAFPTRFVRAMQAVGGGAGALGVHAHSGVNF